MRSSHIIIMCRNYAFIVLMILGYVDTGAQNKDNVVVLPMQIAVPADAKKIGTLKIGDNALTINCDYEADIQEAKDKAKAMGGNLVKITRLIAPAFISKCYKIQADIYYVPDLSSFTNARAGEAAMPENTKPPYALLYIYRLKDTLALEPSYDLHKGNDSIICRVKRKMQKAVKIYDTGTITLWAKSGQRTEITLNIRPGENYYLRCGLKHGDLKLIPFMEVMDKTKGAYEYGKLNKSNTGAGTGLEYLRQVH